MKVRNIIGNAGNAVKNQFEITGDDGSRYFQSYDTIIVKIEKGIVYLDEKAWDYSKTTSKYRNIFLGRSTKEIKDRIKSGEYKLANLNG